MPLDSNPLLLDQRRIPFDQIRAAHVVPGVLQVLEEGRQGIESICAGPLPPSYATTVELLDDITERVRARIAPVTHLLSVSETPELREAFNEVLPEITEFWTQITLNEALWARLKAFGETKEAAVLSGIHERHFEAVMRDFRRAGAELPPGSRDRIREIRLELARLEHRFSENVLDATNADAVLVRDGTRLDGIPDADREQASRRAADAGKEGCWLLTLDDASFELVMKSAKDRVLRKELFDAHVSRCRDGEFSNVQIMRRVLALRRELAEVLGYSDFADFRLEDHMAKTGRAAFEFIEEMTRKTRPYWERDAKQLSEHAEALGLEGLYPWDTAFVGENLRLHRYDIHDEATRPYFPLSRVLEGLFDVARRVFGLVVRERKIEETWHPDVRFYDLFEEDAGTHLGSFYTDWHPRPGKRQGAWMSVLSTGGPRGDGFTPHVGVIAGNLTPTKGDQPSLLTHREVETVFHEFGHLLHHLTSRVPIASRAGINVAWDFVELPSQIMENWTWEEEALPLFSGHYQTGEPFPKKLSDRMSEARRFMGGWKQMRQLAFGFIDLRLHRDELLPPADEMMAHIGKLMEAYAPGPTFAASHPAASFSHVFSGGYAAAYYSYLWSEVLEADAFGRFKREGIFNRAVGRAYLDALLTRGDSANPEVLFRNFMGRDPDQRALLERNLGAALEAC